MTAEQGPPPSDREIRSAVVDRYAGRARAALEARGEQAADAACCEPADAGAGSEPAPLQFVTLVAGAGAPVCDPDDPFCELPGASVDEGEHFGSSLYTPGELDAVPEAAQLASAGCGNPVAIAELRPGEAVLDLGSGGGIDCFLAAQAVGDGGEVWGLDMTPEMVQLARHNAEQVGATNVRFRLGEIKDMPFPDATFDALLSNCVINLSTEKARVFGEAARVLRPGGRLRVSDMVLTRELAPEQRADAEQWAGCIAGALPVDEYLDLIRDAGFVDVSAQYEPSERGITSAYVSARLP